MALCPAFSSSLLDLRLSHGETMTALSLPRTASPDRARERGADHGFFDRHYDRIEVGAPTGCWLWNGEASRKGYGKVMARGKKRLTHREAYEATHGEGSAEGLVVRHRCDTPACVNPSHLEIGTIADNNRDMIERGRHRYVAHKGEANGSAKLTEADVQAIRATYVPYSDAHNQYVLAAAFGVDRSTIGQIIRRKIWVHASAPSGEA